MPFRTPLRRVVLLSLSVALLATAVAAQRTIRVSVSTQGAQAGGLSDRPALSADGSVLVFTSAAGDLVANDANGVADVFVRDLRTGTTVLASVSLSGAAGDGPCLWPVISADGRWVSFTSLASDLVVGDSPGTSDIFVRDLELGVTERVNVSSQGVPADGGGRGSALSRDGRYVAFVSVAGNLVSGDTNACDDIFVRDRLLGTTERVSVSSTGAEGHGHSGGPWISDDGRFVSFGSEAGEFVPDDTNRTRDVFVHDRQSGTTVRVSKSSQGVQGDGISGFNHLSGYFTTFVSPDGRWVVFHSYAGNLVPDDTNQVPDVFVHDRTNGKIERVSVASDGSPSDGPSYFPVLFGDGRWVSFKSAGTGLVAGDDNGVEDVFVHDRITRVTSRISLGSVGEEGTLESDYPTAALDGSVLVFESAAENLVPGDTNGAKDLFLRRLQLACAPPTVTCAAGTSAAAGCEPEVAWTGLPSASSVVPFELTAADLPNQRAVLLLYGFARDAVPMGSSTLCIAPPLELAAPGWSGGSPSGSDCSGAYTVDFSALVQGGAAGLFSGREVHVQFWVREPSAAFPSLLSEGVEFLLGP
jgi:Tol biopolymer transport system component